MANSSVTVSGISDADLAALQRAGTDGGSANPSIDQMRYETQVAPAYTPAPSPSVLESLPSMDEINNYLANLPAQAQRFLTNPAAFTEMLTGNNPLPEQAGFAASATGLPAQNPNSLFTPAGMAYNKGYESGEPVSIAAMGVPALAPAGRFLGSAAADRIMAGKSLVPGVSSEFVNPQIMSAVKNKGGNWLQGATDRLDSLKYPIGSKGASNFDFVRDNANAAKIAEHVAEMEKIGYSPSQIHDVLNEIALNKWVDTKIKPYVRNEMGTPTDPVRELHEQGISHINTIANEPFNTIHWLKEDRQRAGLPSEGFAKSPQARDWENRTDQAIMNKSAGMHIKQGESASAYDASKRNLINNPWLRTVPPETPVHSINSNVNGLGFEHLTDELKNAISHNSDLPVHLRIKPETLDKMTVPHAVKHVAKINKYRAEQMANAAKEDLKHFPVVHEGDKGFKIHELKLPDYTEPELHFEKTSDGVRAFDKDGNRLNHPTGGYNFFSSEDAARSALSKTSPSYKASFDKLDRALKNEGEQMGHCVGGYTDSVASGKSRIFSLRDADGGAHATVEVIPSRQTYNPALIPDEVKAQIDKKAYDETVKAGYPKDSMGWLHHYTGVQIQEGEKYFKNNPMLNIPQIRGKGNGKITGKYQGYIKDWLNKEANKIGTIDPDEMRNAGLFRGSDVLNDSLHKGGAFKNIVNQQRPNSVLPNEEFAKQFGKKFYSNPEELAQDVIKYLDKKNSPVKEQKMLQGFYRGYAGEGVHPEGTTFVSPQKAVADYYAQKRAGQTGLTPHAEMVLADPFAGAKYGHATAGTGSTPNIVTQARKLEPSQIVNRTQLYKKGGRVKMNEGGEPPKLTPFEQFKIDNAELIRQGQEDIANRNKYNPYKGSDRPVPTSKGMSGGAGYVPGTTNPFNPDSPLNRKNGGKIPSIDEMRLTILRNK